MSELGTTAKAFNIGIKGDGNFIWHACEGCGKERWVQLKMGKPIFTLCRKCCQPHRTGEQSQNWKGGVRIHSQGYRLVYVDKTNPFYPMATIKYVPEHRLIMAKHLGRCLQSWEIVHHKNHIKTDNRIENLELFPSQKEHLPDTLMMAHVGKLELRIRQLESRVTQLEAENILLRGNETLCAKFGMDDKPA